MILDMKEIISSHLMYLFRWPSKVGVASSSFIFRHTRRNEKYFIHPLLSRVWRQHGYQKKRNSSGKSIFLVWCAVFQSKLNKLQKTLKIGQKTAHQTKKIEFPEEFCFFWYPYCPQTHDNSG